MLVKNHNDELIENFPNSINSILCYNAFTKASIIQKFSDIDTPTILLDFDLLFTGYIESGIISKNNDLTIYAPTKENWQDIFKKIIIKISSQKTVLIIDSLNGFFSIFDEKDSGRYANSCMIMFSSVIKSTNGKIFMCSIAKLKENEGWILHPTGRHVLENKSVDKFFVRKQEDIQVEALSLENKTEKIFQI